MLPLLVVTAVNIFSVPLFYRYLGPKMYALWFYVLTFSGSFGFADLGLGVAVGRYIGVARGRGDHEAVRSYWATGNVIAIPLLAGMALVFIVIGVVFGPRWFNVASDKVHLLQWSFVAGGLSLFLSYYGQFWNILSQAYLDFKFLSIVRIVISLLQILPAILIAHLTGNPVLLILWTAFTAGIQLLVYIWHARISYSLGFRLSEARWFRVHEMAAYTGKTFLTLLVNSLLGSVDRLLLGRLASAADFAHYNISTNVGGRISGLSAAVMGPVFHNTSRAVGDSSRATPAQIYNETFRFMFGWYLLAAVWATVWAKPALTLWLGSDLGLQVEPIFAPIIIAFCLTAISNISGAQLGSLNRVGTGIFFHAAAGLLLALGVWVGWKMGGIQGVAYGFLASRLALVAQDFFVITLIKGGGWLAFSTWIQIVIQALVGLLFHFLSRFTGNEIHLIFALAILHSVVVSAWLCRGFLTPTPKLA